MRLWVFASLFASWIVAASEPVASRYSEPYPAAASKKGLQVEMVDDAIELGVKHAALNFNLCQLVDPAGRSNSASWTHEGKTYHFKRSYLEGMDRQIKTLSDRGIVVSLIALTYQSGNRDIDRLMIHPNCISNAPNRLGAFNTVTEEGRGWLAATMAFVPSDGRARTSSMDVWSATSWATKLTRIGGVPIWDG